MIEVLQAIFFISDVYAGVLDEAPPLQYYFVNVLRFLLSVSGSVAVIAIILAGVMYMTSGGNASRVTTAKQYLLWSIIGLCIILLSLVIVSAVARTLL